MDKEQSSQIDYEKIERIDIILHKIHILVAMVICTSSLFAITIGGDIYRSSLCNKAAYGTVITVEENTFLGKVVSYDYNLKYTRNGTTANVTINNCFTEYGAGDIVYFMYNEEHRVFHIPNIFY